MKEEHKNIADTFFEQLPQLLNAENISPTDTDLDKPSLVVIPHGKRVEDLRPYAVAAATVFKPLSRTGTARLETARR